MTKKKIFYVLLTLLSLQMITVGVLKLIGFEPLYQQLDELNIARSFGFGIGLVEVACIAGIWYKPTRGVSLLVLLFLITSAIAVHFGAAVDLTKTFPATISFVLISVILYLNNTQALLNILRQREGI